MRIYIAASWKHEHAVRMLTTLLREQGDEVESFVEKAGRDEVKAKHPDRQSFAEWVWSGSGLEKFRYDTGCATDCDQVVYIGPSGTDAWAEVGAAWAANVPIAGLWAKGEQAGLMRRMVTWYPTHTDLLRGIQGDLEAECFEVACPRTPK